MITVQRTFPINDIGAQKYGMVKLAESERCHGNHRVKSLAGWSERGGFKRQCSSGCALIQQQADNNSLQRNPLLGMTSV